MQRIFVRTTFSGNSATIQDAEIAHRLHSVMRMQKGGQCFVFDASGNEYLAEITAIDKKSVSVGFVKQIMRESEPFVKLHLFPALFKKQRFEWMLEKCTELGVAGFHPVRSEHSILKEHGDAQSPERWDKILVSASEQSERALVPSVHSTQTLTNALVTAQGKIFVAAERSDSKEACPELQAGDDASLFIGPEGGWSPEELALFTAAHATFLSFGKRILRAETACIAGAAILLKNT
jgi:16S rRNA (uracil1498-N3)-methyltransferase